MAALTDARRAVWKAIDNWPDLQNVFAQRLDFENDQSMHEDQPEPSISDVPAIAIVPVSNTPQWFHHRQQHWILALDITIWTPGWILETAEDLLEKLLDAFWRSKPGDTGPTYLEPYQPFQTMGNASFDPARLSDSEGGGTQVMITRTQLALSIRKDPFGSL